MLGRLTEPPLRPTLGDQLGSRDNALNFLRLILAAMVILGHSWPFGGLGHHPLDAVAGIAVNGFFALSGFLIAGSRLRLPLGRYLWRRAMRIFPGFWVCLIVVAFGFAPLSTFFTGESYRLDSAVSYLWSNATLYIRQWGVDATLQHVPVPETWNGSLWTLYFEFGAYLIAGAALSLRWIVERARGVFLILLIITCVASVLARGPLAITTNMRVEALRLGACFLAGMVAFLWRERIVLSRGLAVVCLAVTVLAGIFLPGDWLAGVMAIPLTYLLLYFGARLRTRIGASNDVSYGVYIYACPVQQLLCLLNVPALGVAAYAFTSLVMTLPLAWLSWKFIERPALRAAHGRISR